MLASSHLSVNSGTPRNWNPRGIALAAAFAFFLALSGCGNDPATESDGNPNAVKEHPKIAKARELVREKDYEGAIVAVHEILTKEKDNVDALAFTGYVYLKQGRLRDAREWSERALKLDAYLALPLAVKAGVDFKTRRFDSALEQARKALLIDPKTALAYQIIGDIYLRRGYMEQSVQVLEQAAALEPDDAELLNILSSAYLKTKNHPAALKVLLKAVELDQQMPGVHLNLALTYAAMGEGMPALKHIGISEVLYVEAESKQWVAKVRDVRRNIERKFNVSPEQVTH